MTERLPRLIAFFAPAAVMSAWATVMLHSLATGQIKELLSPLFRDYVLVASISLLVLSALYLFLYQPPPVASPKGWLRSTGRWLVLFVPVIAAAMLSPSTLSGTTLANRAPSTAGAAPMPTWSSSNDANTKALLDSDPNQPVPVEVTDLIALSRAPEQMKAFEGRKVRVVGLLNRAGGGDPTIFRWIMYCCAADAQPASVQLAGKADGDWKDTQWLEAVGTVRFPSTLGHVVPTIELDSIKPTGEPDEPYLSP